MSLDEDWGCRIFTHKNDENKGRSRESMTLSRQIAQGFVIGFGYDVLQEVSSDL